MQVAPRLAEAEAGQCVHMRVGERRQGMRPPPPTPLTAQVEDARQLAAPRGVALANGDGCGQAQRRRPRPRNAWRARNMAMPWSAACSSVRQAAASTAGSRGAPLCAPPASSAKVQNSSATSADGNFWWLQATPKMMGLLVLSLPEREGQEGWWHQWRLNAKCLRHRIRTQSAVAHSPGYAWVSNGHTLALP